MRLIHHAVRKRVSGLARVLRTKRELLDRRVLLCYYTRDRIMEPATKVGFVEPDITSLDRIGLTFPEFGKRIEGVSSTVRPGAYGLIADDARRIAAVATATGIPHFRNGRNMPAGTALEQMPKLLNVRSYSLLKTSTQIRCIGCLDVCHGSASGQLMGYPLLAYGSAVPDCVILGTS